jgi:hypothetical protein
MRMERFVISVNLEEVFVEMAFGGVMEDSAESRPIPIPRERAPWLSAVDGFGFQSFGGGRIGGDPVMVVSSSCEPH